jgi:hypothetical protein
MTNPTTARERPTLTLGHLRRVILLGSLDSKISSSPQITSVIPPIALSANESQSANEGFTIQSCARGADHVGWALLASRALGMRYFPLDRSGVPNLALSQRRKLR